MVNFDFFSDMNESMKYKFRYNTRIILKNRFKGCPYSTWLIHLIDKTIENNNNTGECFNLFS